MDVAHELAHHVAGITFDDLTETTRRQTKRFILDTLAVAAAGTQGVGINAVVEVLAAQGGAPEATVIGHPQRLPATSAALLNGAMIHAWEYDDVHDEAFLHAYCAVLPAALAVGERQRAGGREVLTAVALGIDLACRLSQVVAAGRGWYYSATCGTFGAAAAAAKLLGLDGVGILNSLGIALSQAAGTSQASNDGAVSKRLQPGFAARAGTLSALLAANGVSGAQQVFEGAYGFFRLYAKRQVDTAPLTNGLGRTYLGDSLSIKPYPCCRGAHGAIDAALRVRREQHLAPHEVERMTVSMPPVLFDLLHKQVELSERAVIDAQFSIPYVVACAIVHGEVKLAHFLPSAIGDPQVQKLAHCVSVQRSDLGAQPQAMTPIHLEVRCTDGRAPTGAITTLKGGPPLPFSEAERLGKARECFDFAGAALRANCDHLLDLASAIDEIGDVTTLMDLLQS